MGEIRPWGLGAHQTCGDAEDLTYLSMHGTVKILFGNEVGDMAGRRFWCWMDGSSQCFGLGTIPVGLQENGAPMICTNMLSRKFDIQGLGGCLDARATLIGIVVGRGQSIATVNASRVDVKGKDCEFRDPTLLKRGYSLSCRWWWRSSCQTQAHLELE